MTWKWIHGVILSGFKMGGIRIRTDENWRQGALPRLEGENEDIMPGSPLAVIGLWIFALRNRFSYSINEPLPWVWRSELKPENDQDGNPLPDGSPRKLLIESAYNVEKAVRNYRPAIYVGRSGGPVIIQKNSVNNLVGTVFPTGLKAYHCMATMPMIFECEAEAAGESSALAESAWAFVLTTREIFRKDFGLHEITEPVLGDTTPTKTDKEIWATNVQFHVTYDMRWSTRPIAPILKDLSVTLQAQEDLNNYLTELAIRDVGSS